MRQVFDGLQAKVAGTPFESVESPEHPIERVFVGGVFLEHEDTLFDVL